MTSLSQAVKAITEKLYGWLSAIVVSLPNLLLAILVMTAFTVLARWAHRAVTALFNRTDFNRTLENLLAGTVKVVVLGLGFVLALSVLQLEKTVFSMLAGVGVIGLALGFAFQDLASNFISGIMIAVRAPMKVNDVIQIGDVTGKVIALNLRDTILRNGDGQDVYIPNKSFMTEKFANFSTYGKRKIAFKITIGLSDDAAAAGEAMCASLASVKAFLNDPKPSVQADSFGEHGIVFSVEGWIKFPGGDAGLVKHEMILAVKQALDAEGFLIASGNRLWLQGDPADAGEMGARNDTSAAGDPVH